MKKSKWATLKSFLLSPSLLLSAIEDPASSSSSISSEEFSKSLRSNDLKSKGIRPFSSLDCDADDVEDVDEERDKEDDEAIPFGLWQPTFACLRSVAWPSCRIGHRSEGISILSELELCFNYMMISSAGIERVESVERFFPLEMPDTIARFVVPFSCLLQQPFRKTITEANYAVFCSALLATSSFI